MKGLFLHLAEKINHPWFKKLNLEKIDLGSGKRVIFENGVLDKKYNITVPKDDSYEEV
ncbi:MAG: type IV toxin-antitoxin system AbiEi family antitoxin domain-containing protein [Pseudomonadota bacterium]